LAGAAGVGKDTVADYLVLKYGFVSFSFSDSLYREVAEAFGLPDESLLRDRATKEVLTTRLMLNSCSDGGFLTALGAAFPFTMFSQNAFLKPRSPREILQWWGTQYRRAQNPNYWIKRAKEHIFTLRAAAEYPEHAPQMFVNTGVRFENERAWVHSFGGNVWHISRPAAPPVVAHESETLLPILPGERTLRNHRTLADLEAEIVRMMTPTEGVTP
jgi:hypothetical protein